MKHKEKEKLDVREIGCGNEKLMKIEACIVKGVEPLWSITRGFI
jgi:hypothetical protein